MTSQPDPQSDRPQAAKPPAEAAGGIPDLDPTVVSRTPPASPAAHDQSETVAFPEHSSQHQQKAPTTSPREDRSAGLSPQILGRYQVLSQVGRGGFGAVYIGHDPVLDRKVAIKVPRRAGSAEEAAAFLAEARRLAQLKHPGIVAVHDVGEHAGTCFIVTELLEGQTLSESLKSRTVDWAEAVSIVAQIAEALAHAHAQSVVHRDIKPANIFLTRDGRPVLLDFGLGLTEDETAGAIDQVAGTPSYMSPEQAAGHGHRIDGRTDIYSLGVVLYRLLSGKPPFRAGATAELLRKISQDEPQPLRQLNPQIAPQLEQVCHRAIAKRQADRFTTAGDFAAALRQVLPGTGPKAPPTAAPFEADPVTPRSSWARGEPASASAGSHSRRRRDAERRMLTLVSLSIEAVPVDDERTDDPENRHALLQEFAARAEECISAYGGTRVAASGQSILACFGFPVAYEDSAQRGVRAALKLVSESAVWTQAWGDRLGIRAAPYAVVHTGEVVAEVKGDGTESSVSLVGEATTVLARLEQEVDSQTVTITEPTRQLVAKHFVTEPAGERRLRGVAHPVTVFRVLRHTGLRNRVDAADPGSLTPLVGRSTELGILTDRWEQTLEGLGQIVLLIGDAGLGKSRLIREIREHVLGESGSAGPVVMEWRCSAYHQNSPYYPLIDYLSQTLQFERIPEAADRVRRISLYLDELKLGQPQNIALFARLLSVPFESVPPLELSPQKLRELMERLLHQWVQQLSKQRPVLFIVEDLHWVDPSTLQFLADHVEGFGEQRLLSIFTFRPEFETPWKSKPFQTQLALNRLTRRQIAEMMARRVGRDRVPEAIIEQIVQRTDGVPLFIEEFTSLVQEAGLLDRSGNSSESKVMRAIPASLRDLLIARLDRMASNPEVVQLASAIGREFSYRLLAAVSDLPESELRLELDKLVRAELVFQKGAIPEATFLFKHALIQDSAYQSLLKKTRHAFHRRIAEALEQQFAGDAGAEVLAEHYTQAGESTRAVEWWLKAGAQSQERSAHIEAIAQLSRALELILQSPESPERDASELGVQMALTSSYLATRGYASPTVEEHIQRARELCERLGPGSPLFHVMMVIWALRFIQRRNTLARGLSDELLALAADRDAGHQAEAHWSATCTAWWAGRYGDALEHSEAGSQCHDIESSTQHARFTQQNSGPLLLAYGGLALWSLGRGDQARERMRQAVELAEQLKHPYTLAVTCWKPGFMLQLARDGRGAAALAERVLEVSERHSFAFWIALGRSLKGAALGLQGEHREALTWLRDGLACMEATGCEKVHEATLAAIAESAWALGEREAAWQALNRALQLMENDTERYLEPELRRLQATFLLEESPTNAARALELLALALSVARAQSARVFELRIATQLARCRLPGDEGRAAVELVRQLADAFVEDRESADYRAARHLLDQVAP